jgi:hypothetical protein
VIVAAPVANAAAADDTVAAAAAVQAFGPAATIIEPAALVVAAPGVLASAAAETPAAAVAVVPAVLSAAEVVAPVATPVPVPVPALSAAATLRANRCPPTQDLLHCASLLATCKTAKEGLSGQRCFRNLRSARHGKMGQNSARKLGHDARRYNTVRRPKHHINHGHLLGDGNTPGSASVVLGEDHAAIRGEVLSPEWPSG